MDPIHKGPVIDHATDYNTCHDNVMTWVLPPHYWPFVRGTIGVLVSSRHDLCSAFGNVFDITLCVIANIPQICNFCA